MGGVKQDINLKGDPAVVLIAGLQGSGKTTFSGKLAQYIKKEDEMCYWLPVIFIDLRR